MTKNTDKNCWRGFRVLKDEAGQALTEFAIVIPIVLLMFFTMLQSYFIVQSSQLGNYAAYAAARVYAVRAAVDGEEEAQRKARKAAIMALAPVARLMPGEISLFGFDISRAQSFLSSLSDSVTGKIFGESASNGSRMVLNYTYGYIVADNLRLNEDILGGDISITTSGSPKQVNVEINYPQPLFVPGLAFLWNSTPGQKFLTGVSPLSEGLDGIPERLRQGQQRRDSWQDMLDRSGLGITLPNVSDATDFLGFSMCPYANIQSKCSIGYEDWGSKDAWRPRQAKDARQGETSNPELEAKQADAERLSRELQEAQKKSEEECKDQDKAQKEHKTAEDELADTEPETDERRSAESKLRAATRRLEDAVEKCEKSKEAMRAKQAELENGFNDGPRGNYEDVKDRATRAGG